jgi:hypothetical protein
VTNPQGDTLSFTWRLEQGEREQLDIPVLADGVAEFDLTGWTVDAQVKTAPGGKTLYTWPPELIHISGHTITLLVPGPVSQSWGWTTGWWRVVVTEPSPADPADPDTFRIIQGSVLVVPS